MSRCLAGCAAKRKLKGEGETRRSSEREAGAREKLGLPGSRLERLVMLEKRAQAWSRWEIRAHSCLKKEMPGQLCWRMERLVRLGSMFEVLGFDCCSVPSSQAVVDQPFIESI